MTGAVHKTEGENMADVSKFQLVTQTRRSCQSAIASSHPPGQAVSHAIYIATIPSRHTSTWQACHDQKQSLAHSTMSIHGESKTQIDQAK
jgi:hypothetical protein